MHYWSSLTVALEFRLAAPVLTDFSSATDTSFLPIFANLEISMLMVAVSLAVRPALSVRCRRKFLRPVLFAVSSLLAGFALKAEASAEESRTLIIPPNDGYGFEECLKTGSACGLVVADAWCKAHGFAGSKGFGPADETTGAADAPPGSFHVTCGGHLD
jgi:hypothetical protein